MSFLPFFFANWKYIGLAILLSMLFVSRIQLSSAEKEIDALKTQSRLENAVREAQAREAKSKSDSTLKRINDEHKTVVEQAEKNAWRNFTKRYSTGTGFNGCGSIGLRLPASQSSSDVADSPKGANDPTGEFVVIDRNRARLSIEACARDAGRLKEFQDWVIGNGFPIEK